MRKVVWRPSRLAKAVWPLALATAGGVHKFGRLWVIVHDRGVTIAWRQVERARWEW